MPERRFRRAPVHLRITIYHLICQGNLETTEAAALCSATTRTAG
jgi:hypothetical protein